MVLGGLLMQGKRSLSYEEIRELTGYHADKNAVQAGIQTHEHPTFQNRSANADNLPDLPLRFAFVGTSEIGRAHV